VRHSSGLASNSAPAARSTRKPARRREPSGRVEQRGLPASPSPATRQALAVRSHPVQERGHLASSRRRPISSAPLSPVGSGRSLCCAYALSTVEHLSSRRPFVRRRHLAPLATRKGQRPGQLPIFQPVAPRPRAPPAAGAARRGRQASDVRAFASRLAAPAPSTILASADTRPEGRKAECAGIATLARTGALGNHVPAPP